MPTASAAFSARPTDAGASRHRHHVMDATSTRNPAFAGLHAPIPLHGAGTPAPSSLTTLLPTNRRRRPHALRIPVLCVVAANSSDVQPAPIDADEVQHQYVPLHVHSDFSLLDGASQVSALAQRAKELGVPALALTDHGVLYGAVALVRACTDAGVKPVIGNEMYIVNGDPTAPTADDVEPLHRYHIVVLARNTTGYRNLVKLTTMAHLHGKVGNGSLARPCINKDALFQHRDGLIVSSSGHDGEIAQAILQGDAQKAREVANWFKNAFGEDFYLEIQSHGNEDDKVVNRELVRIGKELNIKIIATNDSHFTSLSDAEAHDALVCIQTGNTLMDENRMRYAGNEYFKSADEMRLSFIDHLDYDVIDEALQNTIAVAEKVEKYDLFGETRIPHYPVPGEFENDPSRYLAHISRKGLTERLVVRQKSGLADEGADEEYRERLEFELEMIDRMGFSSYFLVVWDYIRYAREQGIPVGPGRGSVAGSLVAFALRITDVDPMAFNLLFERFLNPERRSMPDIDTDFSVAGREKVISYVSERYGKDRVAQIITFNRLTSKAVLKDIARVHNVPYSEADKLAKLIPVFRGKPVTLAKMMSDDTPSPEFKKLIESNSEHRNWIEKARRVEGVNKTFGIHAAGVVISASPLTDAVPLSIAKHGETITQYPMEDVESLGLLKMDFLGLKNLSVIESALRFVNAGRRRKGIMEDLDFSVDALPLNDRNTFQLLATGELDGIFQLDASLGMRNIVRELKPTSLEDISAVLALYRPGPLDAGLIPKFIRRKHGREAIQYDHPLLEPILRDTYGIMVYQEQIMRIARDLAGYSLGQADILRRAMGKKKVKDMEKEKPRFIQGAVERGVPKKTAEKLFEMMIQFAEYCFNKSHSTAYAYLTYQTAYLKANYPVEYAAALLGSNMTSPDKLVRYLSDANVSGVKVKPPSINRSEIGFTVQHEPDGEAVVMFGLEAVKTVGSAVSEAIIEERAKNGPFKSIIDLVERLNSRVLNKRSMSALVLCGAFDELHPNRKVLSEQLEDLLNLRRKLRDRRKRREKKKLSEDEEQAELQNDAAEWDEIQLALDKSSGQQPDFDLLEKLKAEKKTLGFYASGHPLYDLVDYRRFLDSTPVSHVVGDIDENSDFEDSIVHDEQVKDGDSVAILSLISELSIKKTARGHKMAKWMAEDDKSRMQAIVFPAAYAIVEQIRESTNTAKKTDEENLEAEEEPEKVVEQDARVVVWGRVDKESSGNVQLFVDDVQRVEDVSAVVVTARYNPERPPDLCKQIAIRYVGELLDVSYEAPSMSYTYKDKNGNLIERRRRPGKVNYKTKRRKPCILKYLGEGDNPPQYSNIGNQYRFGEVSQEDIQWLQGKTGYKVEVVNIFDEVKSNVSVQAEEKVELTVSDVLDSVEPHILEDKELDLEQMAEEDTVVEEGKLEKEASSITPEKIPVATQSIKFEQDLFVDESSLVIEAYEEEPTVSSSQAETTPVAPRIKKSDKDLRVPAKLEVVDEKKVDSVSDPAEDFAIVLEKYKKFGKPRSEYDYLRDDEFEKFVRDSVELRERRKRLAGTVEPATRETNGIMKPIEYPNKWSSPRRHVVPQVVPKREPVPVGSGAMDSGRVLEQNARVVVLGRVDSVSGQLLVDNVHRVEDVTIKPAERPSDFYEAVARHYIGECLDLRGELVRRSAQRERDTSPMSRKNGGGGDGGTRDMKNPPRNEVEAKISSYDDEESAVEHQQMEKEVNEAVPSFNVSNRAIVEQKSEVANGVADKVTESIETNPTDFAKEWKITPRRSVQPSISKRDGLRIRSNETGRLLDLICYVGSDAVFKHCHSSFQILFTSKFDFTKVGLEIQDDLLVNITARIASVELNCVSVHVMVSESEPTGGRMRARNLTSGVLVFRATGEAPGLISSTVVAKLRKRNVQDAFQSSLDTLNTTKRLGAAAWMGSTKKKRSRRTNQPKNEEHETLDNANALHHADTVKVFTSTRADLPTDSMWLSDGGQLLSWMSNAAENCVQENIPGVTRACVVGLELMHMPHTLDAECNWNEVNIRAKLSQAAGSILMVDVAAQLVKQDAPNAESITVQAVFKVDCRPLKATSSIQFCENKWVPFDAVGMQSVTPLLDQLCTQIKQTM